VSRDSELLEAAKLLDEAFLGRERETCVSLGITLCRLDKPDTEHTETHTHSLEVQTMEFTGVDLEEEGLLLDCAGERTASESPRRCSPKVDDDGVALG